MAVTRDDIPRGAPSRSFAIEDCRRAAIFYAVGDRVAGDRAIALALSTMATAWRLDKMRGDPTEVS